MRRDHRRKLKFLDANYPIGTTQCLARATTDLHPKGAFLESSYDLPLLAVGSGGSLTAAHMAALLHEKTGMVSKSITPLELLSNRTSFRKTSILLLTAGGRNSDILTSFKYAATSEPRQLMAICTRTKSPLSNLAKEFRYARFLDFDVPSGKDGFLVSRQPYNVVRYISYVPHIQLEGIEHEELHRDAN